MQVNLGAWNLSDLVKDGDFQYYIDYLRGYVRDFKLNTHLQSDISSEEFNTVLVDLSNIEEMIRKLASYAYLKYYANTKDNEASSLVAKIEKVGSEIKNELLFFDLWFKKELDPLNAKRLILLAPLECRNYLEHKREIAKHTLPELVEKTVNILDVTGIIALLNIYDKFTGKFTYLMNFDGGKKQVLYDKEEEVRSFVRSIKAEERENAYKALFRTYEANSGVLGEFYSNIVLNWNDKAKMRSHVSPISIRNIENNVDNKTVESLLTVCKNNVFVFQNYFKEKAKMLNMDKLRRYDLYAPLPSATGKTYSYQEAIHVILDAFNSFDPLFKNLMEKVIKEQHVDSEMRTGKRSGAFCQPVSSNITPYVLVNFDGKGRSVATLAHEFGHAIHSLLVIPKSTLVYDPPLPLAETASVFGEMILFDKLTENMSNEEKKIELAEFIDGLYATIIRQSYFTRYEIDAHEAIVNRNITVEDMQNMWLNNLREQFGNSVDVSEDFKYESLYIPHIYHTPFYCYAYSFGNLLVLSLYKMYKEQGSSFMPTYIDILSSGGSRKPEELLLSHGIDIQSPRFWQRGFDLVSEKVKQLRELN